MLQMLTTWILSPWTLGFLVNTNPKRFKLRKKVLNYCLDFQNVPIIQGRYETDKKVPVLHNIKRPGNWEISHCWGLQIDYKARDNCSFGTQSILKPFLRSRGDGKIKNSNFGGQSGGKKKIKWWSLFLIWSGLVGHYRRDQHTKRSIVPRLSVKWDSLEFLEWIGDTTSTPSFITPVCRWTLMLFTSL